jgi:hypothetical protein
MKDEAAKAIWGDMIEISKPEFEIQVTRAPKDALVIIHLY